MRIQLSIAFAIAGVVPSLAAPLNVVSIAGLNPAAIQTTVDQFRTGLGALNPNVAGSFGSGRREINWDGVPAALSAPNNLPANFFNSNSPRGAEFSGGSGFQVSGADDAATAGVNEARFGNLNPNYPSEFQTFSATKLFTSLGSNIYDVNFFVPGSNTPATTRGFGAVFVDVDLLNLTSLEFFDAQSNSLGQFFAPVQNGGLSFLGATLGNVNDPGIARVRFTLGNQAIGPNENPNAVEFPSDVVVLDDFIYGEPNAASSATPEPASLALCGAGLVAVALFSKRRV